MLKWCGHWFASLTLWLSGWFPMLRAPATAVAVEKGVFHHQKVKKASSRKRT